MHCRTILLALLIAIPACSKEPAAPAPPTASAPPAAAVSDGHPQIAFIPVSAPSPETEALHAGAEKALAQFKKGTDGKPIIDLLWQTPSDKSTQAELAQSLLKQGVAAIIIEPDNQDSLNAVTASRIPVIAINTTLQDANLKSTINFPPNSTDKDYNLLAYTAVKTAADCIREKKVEKKILLPAQPATPK